MIRPATTNDLPEILNITRACAAFMISKNIFQWDENYPSRGTFKKDIDRNELWVLQEKEQLIGCIVITNLIDPEYIPIKWLTKTAHNLYIHRLAVHPEHHGKGHAQKLMHHAENYAREHSATSIRLDTFSKNLRNQEFYESRGYKRLESIYLLEQSEHPFYCYELLLINAKNQF